MGEVAHATTDAQGHYSLNEPGSGPYLIRVTHQGAGYFIAAPQGGAPGDIPVYDVAAKVEGVFIEADVFEIETDNGQLRVTERYFVHNTSLPPRTEWSPRTFEIVLPPEAVVAGVAGAAAHRPAHQRQARPRRPQGPLRLQLSHPARRGRQEHALPDRIQPALQRRQVHLPSRGDAAHPEHRRAAAQEHDLRGRLRIDLPVRARGPQRSDLRAKNAVPGKAMEFTISGTGSMPREQQADNGGQAAAGAGSPGTSPAAASACPSTRPTRSANTSGGFWAAWRCCMAAAAAFLLRKPAGARGWPGASVT